MIPWTRSSPNAPIAIDTPSLFDLRTFLRVDCGNASHQRWKLVVSNVAMLSHSTG